MDVTDADLSDARLVHRLTLLQHAAYRVEAALVGAPTLPPLEADEAAVAGWTGELRLAWEGDRLLGAVAWEESDVVGIDRLMVDPAAHRRGLGTVLLKTVLAAAGSRDVVVSTAAGNAPALALYARHAFAVVGRRQVPTGLWLVDLRRPASVHPDARG